jgi:hypothetical protein
MGAKLNSKTRLQNTFFEPFRARLGKSAKSANMTFDKNQISQK